MAPLGDLPGGGYQSEILAGSADGNVLVGQGTSDIGLEAIVWDPVNGMRALQDALQLDITGGDLGALDGWTLVCATGISADGTMICGYGTDPGGLTQGFVCRLRRYCYANCDASNVLPALNASDMLCFLDRFAAGDPYANCDDSTSPPVLNANDFLCFLGKFAAGCP